MAIATQLDCRYSRPYSHPNMMEEEKYNARRGEAQRFPVGEREQLHDRYRTVGGEIQ